MNAVVAAPVRIGGAMGCLVIPAAGRLRGTLLVAAALLVGVGIGDGAHEAWAYSAAGDRVFAPTIMMPQIAPGDDVYLWGSTQPDPGGTERNEFNGTVTKTITEHLGITLGGTWTRLDGPAGTNAVSGWFNFDTELKYLAITNQPHEFLMSLAVDREWPTGVTRAGAFQPGATTPRVYMGKGLGDLDIGLLRPLAVRGMLGYQIADEAPRPNMIQAEFAAEYSIPYLQSKVHSFNLPPLLRGLTPITEVEMLTPAGKSYGSRTFVLVAPGVSYAGEGWDFLVEALIPGNKTANSSGLGVAAQLHLSLDYLMPGTIGRPLFSAR